MGRAPLVGRDEEFGLLAAAYADDAVAGAVVSGEAGVGKTRLASEFVAHLASKGAETVWSVGTRSVRAIPLGAFAPFLSREPESAIGFDAFAAARDALKSRAEDRPLVVAVDDAHLLDDASAALLHQLTLVRDAFVVVTVRTGEPTPDAVRALWKDDLALLIELQPLSEREVGEYVTDALDGPVDGATVRRLAELTRGNALYLREVLAAGRARGALVQRGDVWSWTGAPVVGTRIAELIREHLGSATGDARELLHLVALGEPVPIEVIRALDPAEVTPKLVRDGLVSIGPEATADVVRLAHPLYAEVLREDLTELDRRGAAHRLADAFEATEIGDHLRIAAWRLDAGDPIAPDQLAGAARTAILRHDQALAERLARPAVEGGAGYAALDALAEALYWQGRYDEAEAILAGCNIDAAPAEERVALSVLRGSTLFWGLGRTDDAVDVLTRASSQEALGHRAMIEILAGRTQAGEETAKRVVTGSGPGTRAHARATGALVHASALTGRVSNALELAASGLSHALEFGDDDPTPAGAIVMGQVLALLLAGRLRELEELVDALVTASRSRSIDQFAGLWAFDAGRVALAGGRIVQARSLLREAVALLEAVDVGRILPWCLGAGAQAAGQAGEAEEASELAARADNEQAAITVWRAELGLGQAWAAAAAVELTRARALAINAADVAASMGQPAVEVLALHEAVRLGAADDVADRLRSIAAPLDGPFPARAIAHADALVARDGNRLDDVSGGFADAGAMLYAAEAAAEAAVAHGDAGLTASRAASRARALELLADCDGAATPALTAGLAAPELLSLTKREREVAGLAAQGLTRREIADRLFTSPRTVGNHLNHIYAKLGISTRDELALALTDQK